MSPRHPRLITCVIGTRPEVVKMAPIVRELRLRSWADCRVVVTGQHRELLRPMLDFFDVDSDVDLAAMYPGQSPTELLAKLLLGLNAELTTTQPAMVLAQGDTTSVAAAALAAFGLKIPFAHVEAGLRTHDLATPFPEEGNRQIAGRLATLHFAPTPLARENLLREGIRDDRIHMVGNTVIDSLQWAAARREPLGVELDASHRLILVTSHRRETIGRPLDDVCRAVAELTELFDDVEVLWPVHPNPAVESTVHRRLSGRARIHLCPPLSYGAFAAALNRCHIVLTDSGGVQEEAPAFQKPVLVLRDCSERVEAVEAGVARLVGTDRLRILEACCGLLLDEDCYRAMSRPTSLLGDGTSARQIVDVIDEHLAEVEAEQALPATAR